MKLRFSLLREIRSFGTPGIIYFIFSTLCVFYGNTWLIRYANYFLLAVVVIAFCTTKIKGFGGLGRTNLNGKNSVLILLLFAIYILIQSVTMAYFPSVTRNYGFRFLLYTLALLFVMNIDVLNTQINIFKTYGVIAGFSGIIMTIINGKKSGGFFGDFQALGMMMSIVSLAFIVDYFEDSYKSSNMWGYIFAIACVFISGKRMFTLLSLLALFIMFLLFSGRAKALKIIRITSISLISAIILYFLFPPVREVVNRFIYLRDAGNDNVFTSGRIGMWEVAHEIFLDNKIYGIGFANFTSFTKVNFSDASWAGMYLTHNIYYGLLAETGIIGFGIMVFFLTVSFIKTYKVLIRIRKTDNKILRRVIYFSFLLQIWFIIYGFSGNGIYDTNEFYIYILAITMMCEVDFRNRVSEVPINEC